MNAINKRFWAENTFLSLFRESRSYTQSRIVNHISPIQVLTYIVTYLIITYFANSLDDSTDTRNRIVTMKRVLQSMDIPEPTGVRAYEATVLNILLHGCESWALKEADRKRSFFIDDRERSELPLFQIPQLW